MASFVFHLPGSWRGPFGSGVLPFYQRLSEGLTQHGHDVRHVTLDRDTALARVAQDTA